MITQSFVAKQISNEYSTTYKRNSHTRKTFLDRLTSLNCGFSLIYCHLIP